MAKFGSIEYRENMSKIKKGQKAWNKGVFGYKRVKQYSDLAKKNISEGVKRAWNQGKYDDVDYSKSKEHKQKLSQWRQGKTYYDIYKDKATEMVDKKRLQMTLEGNINWKGGISKVPYDFQWNNHFRNYIRKRDNQICMMCGVHREKLKRTLAIHHINYDKTLSVPENCISLCNSCHAKISYNRQQWINFFQSLLTERYSYKYNNQKIILEVKNEDKGNSTFSQKGNISSEE